MTWKGMHPLCTRTTAYQTGVTLTKDAMEVVEAHSHDFHTWKSGVGHQLLSTSTGYFIIFESLRVENKHVSHPR